MVRTQIQLREEQATRIKEIAAEQNASMAEIIRRAIDHWLQPRTSVSDGVRRRRAIAAAEGFETGIIDLAENHDRYFAEGVHDPENIAA